jgi:hypothetical protein
VLTVTVSGTRTAISTISKPVELNAVETLALGNLVDLCHESICALDHALDHAHPRPNGPRFSQIFLKASNEGLATVAAYQTPARKFNRFKT